MGSEFYYPHTADRTTRSDWENNGGQDMRQVARAQAKAILQTTPSSLITDEIDQQIRAEFNILLPRDLITQPAKQPTDSIR
jgi:trimethylamine--corrinoid protein Co-methyltransferase